MVTFSFYFLFQERFLQAEVVLLAEEASHATVVILDRTENLTWIESTTMNEKHQLLNQEGQLKALNSSCIVLSVHLWSLTCLTCTLVMLCEGPLLIIMWSLLPLSDTLHTF